MRKLLATAGVVTVLGVILTLLLPLIAIMGLLGAASSAQACGMQPGGTVGGSAQPGATLETLSAVQLQHAQVIVTIGQQLQIPAQGQVVALATALQESKLQNYANDGTGQLRPEQRGVERSLQFPHDAVGRDHGSVNAFQQQYPWWGSVEELMQPAFAAGAFYRALTAVTGWQVMPVTEAAQRVQRSAFPSAYADDEPLARQLQAQYAASGSAAGVPGAVLPVGQLLCGTGLAMDCPPTGLAVEAGLTPDALRVLRCVQQQLPSPIGYGGVAERPDNPRSDHPAGRAVDVMASAGGALPDSAQDAYGQQVAAFVQSNAAGLGVRYIIWAKQQWNADRPEQGWQPYQHPSGGTGVTLDHRDHVHVSVYGDAAGQGAAVSAAGWTLPLAAGSYTLSSGYGPRRSPTGGTSNFHAGLDFAAPTGTPVLAAAAGTVLSAGGAGGYGLLVVIRTDNIDTYYAHQSALAAVGGQQVAAGQVIGAVGSTGNSTGPHLHFEVRVDANPVDPAVFLRQYGVDPGTVL